MLVRIFKCSPFLTRRDRRGVEEKGTSFGKWYRIKAQEGMLVPVCQPASKLAVIASAIGVEAGEMEEELFELLKGDKRVVGIQCEDSVVVPPEAMIRALKKVIKRRGYFRTPRKLKGRVGET